MSPSLNGITGEYDYSRRLHDGTPHSQIDSEYSFMEVSFINT
jgi:hypothetical protein